jgi:hypothetical protein
MDPLDRMFRDPFQHLAEVILGIERIQLGRLCRALNYAECYLERPDSGWF